MMIFLNIKKNYLYSLFLTILSGVFLSLSYPSIFFHGLSLFAPIAYFLFLSQMLKNYSLGKIAFLTFIFNLTFSLLSFYWIPQTLVTFGDLPEFLSKMALVFLSIFILPANWAFFIVLYVFKRFQFSKRFILGAMLITYFLFEQFAPQQFVLWAGHSWLTWKNYFPDYNLPLASYFGAGIYSFIILSICFLAMELIAFPTKKNKLNFFFYGNLIQCIFFITLELVLQSQSHSPVTKDSVSYFYVFYLK
jgi:apolipoprotein N-acyltransferase